MKKFDKHISSSVPLYKEGHELITSLSDFFIKDKSVCYELGCSTGTLLNQISKRHQNKRLNKFIGIDIEKDMIKFAKKK